MLADGGTVIGAAVIALIRRRTQDPVLETVIAGFRHHPGAGAPPRQHPALRGAGCMLQGTADACVELVERLGHRIDAETMHELFRVSGLS
ncbi:hypothetical protein GCM10023086_53390 [Streptomyces venetus]|uniref:Uncharacterized protein n=1 Tax=Streptomyces venetus TaxID=1701086 RepID=A0ABP8GKH8_9ACTN